MENTRRIYPLLPAYHVKLLDQIIRHFYSTEVTTSECQLKKDFGEFPPNPLRGDGLTGQFTTVRVRGIGENLHFAIMVKRLMEGAADADSLSSTIKEVMSEKLEGFKYFGGSKSIGRGMLMWVALAAAFLASAFKLIKTNRQGINSLGFFMPVRKEECEIVLKVEQISKEKLDAASMISHEHIHLLQHKEKHITTHSRDVSWPDERLFTETARASNIFPYLKYILERREVEARLHELVVSFYRTHKNLPLSPPSFLALLAASKQLGWLVSETLTDANVDFGPVLAEVIERDTMQAKDLKMVLLSMPDDLVLKFITEVLPVMYGNLLMYYGDDAMSRDFLFQISRPNFYDQLYALPASGSADSEAVE